MTNIYLIALIISLVFLIVKFIELRFMKRENLSLKSIVVDTILVYCSSVGGYFIMNQLNLQTKSLDVVPAFVDGPGF